MKVILTSMAYALAPQRKGPPLGLKVIENGLKQNGFSAVQQLRLNYFDALKKPVNITDALAAAGATEPKTIIAISTTSDDYLGFQVISDLIRLNFPQATIAAGGPHFVREKIGPFADPVETVLSDNQADVVNVGHAQPFLDFVLKAQGNKDALEIPGLFSLDSFMRVKGYGIGKFPKLKDLPVSEDGDEQLGVILDDSCQNNCGFCSIPNSQSPIFSSEQATEGLGQAFSTYAPKLLSLYDSNPFEGRKRPYYWQVFNNLAKWANLPKAAYIDPALIVEGSDREEILAFVTQNNFSSLFFGRDAVTEHSAQLVGSNYRGKAKTQNQLDNERQALQKFILAMGARHAAIPFRINLSYIISPFETAESALALIDDLSFFTSLSSAGTRIKISYFPLAPYPGTKIRKELVEYFDPNDYCFSTLGRTSGRPWIRQRSAAFKFFMKTSSLLLASQTGKLGNDPLIQNKVLLEIFRRIFQQSFY